MNQYGFFQTRNEQFELNLIIFLRRKALLSVTLAVILCMSVPAHMSPLAPAYK